MWVGVSWLIPSTSLDPQCLQKQDGNQLTGNPGRDLRAPIHSPASDTSEIHGKLPSSWAAE